MRFRLLFLLLCILNHLQVFGWLVHRKDFFDETKSFRITFSYHDFCTLFNQFDTILEFETNDSCITISQVVERAVFLIAFLQVLGDLDRLNCLSHTTNMKHALISYLYCGSMMKYLHLSIKVPYTQTLILVVSFLLGCNWIYQTRSLPYLIVLNWLKIFTCYFHIYAY